MHFMKKILLGLILIVLAFLTFIPRGVEVINHNYLFLFDQGRDYLATKGIVVDHKFVLIGTELGSGSAGISGIFQGPGFHYLLAIPFILFQGDPYGAVVFMFLFSVVAVVAGFFLGKKLWSPRWGLIVSFLFAISPPLISQARFTWSPHPATVLIVLVFLFVYLSITTKKNWAIFLAAFFSGFIYNFESAMAIPMVLQLLVFSLIFWKRSIKHYLFFIGGVTTAFLPMIFFEIRHNFLAVHGIVSYLSSRKVSTGVHVSFFDAIQNHWGTFIYNSADTFPNHGLVPGGILLMVLLALGIWYLTREKEKPIKHFFVYLLLLLPVSEIVFGFLKTSVYQYYLVNLNIVYILLFTYCLHSAWQRKERIISFALSLFLAILLFIGITNAIQTYFHDIHDFGMTSKAKGLKQAIDYIYQDAKGEKFGVLVFTPPIYTYQYDYMFWWYGERKYHYIPYSEKRGLVYLLIEPDISQPWSYKGWLETVIKTGTVIKTDQLSPSGFIVQKRQF